MPVTYAVTKVIAEALIIQNMLLLIRKKFTVKIHQPVRKIIFVHETVIRITVKNGIRQALAIRRLIRWIRPGIRQEAVTVTERCLVVGIKKAEGCSSAFFSGFAHGFH